MRCNGPTMLLRHDYPRTSSWQRVAEFFPRAAAVDRFGCCVGLRSLNSHRCSRRARSHAAERRNCPNGLQHAASSISKCGAINFDFYMVEAKPADPHWQFAPVIATHPMKSYAKTASRWSRRPDPIAASAPRKMDAGFGDMLGAGWSNASSPGHNRSIAFLSAGSFIRGTSLHRATRLPPRPLRF